MTTSSSLRARDPMTTPYVWQTAADTHEGKRRKHNEDAYMVRPSDGLWVVADGMGGHEAGDVASEMVTKALEALEANGRLSSFVDQVDDTLVAVNQQLRETSEREHGGRTMGCTVVTFVARGPLGVCLWAGDSRLYRLRHGELQQISRDHSPLEELIEKGVLTEEEAEGHPDSNVITRAVGGQPDLVLDVSLVDIEVGDTYLLCSDGLYREVQASEIAEHMAADNVEDVVANLLQLALDRGARDNVAIVVSRAVPA